MTEQEFKKLQVGDGVQLHSGEVGYIQWFGKFNGKQWTKSPRKRADAVWIWFPQDRASGYVSRELLKGYLPPSLFTAQEALRLRCER